MTIDMLHFTPGLSLIGGLLIGAASALFILANGRIAGISGILGGLLRPVRGDLGWRLAFLLGLVASPALVYVFMPYHPPTIDADTGTLIAAGLLVGLGTRYGSGCTSGHGVCGLSRLSPRSLVATLAFMGSGMAAVFVMRHLIA
ncbi:MAG: YeeE/YedE family protein [Burkholderiaceae bacterium]|nr:YeeE/YedE family protein [Burkholderiaceae bacterium]